MCLDFYKIIRKFGFFTKLLEICLDILQIIRNRFGFLQIIQTMFGFLQIIRNLFEFLQKYPKYIWIFNKIIRNMFEFFTNYPKYVWIFTKLSNICLDFLQIIRNMFGFFAKIAELLRIQRIYNPRTIFWNKSMKYDLKKYVTVPL